MKLLLSIISISIIVFSAASQSLDKLKAGRWIGCLELSATDHLNFELILTNNRETCSFTILNGEEQVPTNPPYLADDSIHVHFSNFNSAFVFKVKDKKTIAGRWINYLKPDYSIPFSARLSNETIFPTASTGLSSDFSGKWKTVFSPGEKPYDAIGMFNQKGKNITGTFLTETGDFRFLSGNANGNQMYLSGFDGSHAYLFKGMLTEQGELTGEFLSGKSYKTTWNAQRNEQFELRNPDSLTHFVGDPYDLSFEFQDLKGGSFVYPNDDYKGKVIIVQILGTWCANCMDETIYFQELYGKYHDKGLEIISVGYELGANEQEYVRHLEKYRQRFGLEHQVLIGGSAKKSSAREDFSSLSDFTSFPTSLFIDRNGKVVRIHTGFSGPGTGKYYTDYKERTDRLIERLISE